jgi:hypothetical protein
MKSILMKSFAVALLIVAGICSLASCYRFSFSRKFEGIFYYSLKIKEGSK